MSTPLRALLLSAILLIAASAFGQINIVNFDFGAVPIGCSSGYAYEGAEAECTYHSGGPVRNFNASPGFGWILGGLVAWNSPNNLLQGSAGLTGPNTAFNPPSFDGLPFNQAVFLQNGGSFVWQTVGGFTAGSYILSFYLGSRYRNDCCDGNQTVQALIDGNVIGTWALTSNTPFTLQTASFSVTTDGTHTVEFEGINHGDHTAFLSYVTITSTER